MISAIAYASCGGEGGGGGGGLAIAVAIYPCQKEIEMMELSL